MKRLYMYITGLLTLMGCISDYEPDIVNQIGGLLVVDGFITNDTTRIRLSHSVRMLDEFEEGESIRMRMFLLNQIKELFLKR